MIGVVDFFEKKGEEFVEFFFFNISQFSFVRVCLMLMDVNGVQEDGNGV